MTFLALKKWGAIFGPPQIWGQRLEVYVRSSFTVVNLHDLWRNWPRSYRPVHEKWRGNLGATSNFGKHWAWPPCPVVEMPLRITQKVMCEFSWNFGIIQIIYGPEKCRLNFRIDRFAGNDTADFNMAWRRFALSQFYTVANKNLPLYSWLWLPHFLVNLCTFCTNGNRIEYSTI